MTRKMMVSILTLALLIAACSPQQAPAAPAEGDSMAEQENMSEEMADEAMEEGMDDEAMEESMDDEAMDEGMDDESMDMMDSATFTVRIENVSQSDSPGVPVLFAPGAWVVFTEGSPIFTSGEADRGLGLEALAEDGNPAELSAALGEYMGVVSNGVFDTPVDANQPGVAGPGSAYEFNFQASEGERFAFATMFVQSNDLFYAPQGAGIELFTADGEPISGDLSERIVLWDAGTEVNQEPGVGPDQAPRQAGPDTGADENGVVQLVEDMYSYPEGVIRVTITATQ